MSHGRGVFPDISNNNPYHSVLFFHFILRAPAITQNVAYLFTVYLFLLEYEFCEGSMRAGSLSDFFVPVFQLLNRQVLTKNTLNQKIKVTWLVT